VLTSSGFGEAKKREEMRYFFVVFSCIGIILSGWAQGAELDPFVLPSEKQGMQNQHNKKAPSQKESAVEESVYERFKTRIKQLDVQEKEKWLLSFQDKKEKAIKKEAWDEVKHYQRLLELLEKSKAGQ